ncbi:MAG: XrtA/PEP-CTERM system exopolysaccharide export protein [Pseudomonadota bacterium]
MLSACVGLLTACGSPPALPPVEAGASTVPSETDLSKYRIGPGDELEIFVWRNPEISATVPVRPDGKISTPLVEDMVAVGKTPSVLARDIEEVLKIYIKQPQVNVIVTNFQGVYEGQVRVVGQAANPQAIPYREGMTILDVMIAVGGLGEFAAGNRAKLVRNVNGESTEYRIRLNDLMNKGRIDQNVAMRPGDVVIIPEALF